MSVELVSRQKWFIFLFNFDGEMQCRAGRGAEEAEEEESELFHA